MAERRREKTSNLLLRDEIEFVVETKERKIAKLKWFKNFKFVLQFKKLFEPAKKVETDAADTKSIQCDFRGLEPTKYEINLKLLLLQFVTLHSASLNLISTTSNH